jgi:hypothetical protein
MTMSTLAGKSGGSDDTIVCNALRPPREVAITTISREIGF